MIPKVAFRPMTLDENIDVIDWAYFENNGSLDVHNYVLEYYPELSNLEGCDKDIILDRIRDVVSRDYYYYEQKIKDEVIRYQDIWDKYNDNYMLDVSKYLDCDWDDICSISASVGLIPVFPRYLDTHSFCLSTNISEDKLIETVCHESLHFLWFLKWKRLFPSTNRREFDSPFMPWVYSEMVVDPILNNIFNSGKSGISFRSYDSFYHYQYHGKNVMEVLQDIYRENTSIEEKIIHGYQYISEAVSSIKINNYLSQNVLHPDYLFHGSPSVLDTLTLHTSHDSNQSLDNVDTSIFLTSSLLIASCYAFKDKIKEESEKNNLDWDFQISSTETVPIMTMENVVIPDDLSGYIYVFPYNDSFRNEPEDSLQYKSYKNLQPIDVVLIHYSDFKKYYVLNNKSKSL